MCSSWRNNAELLAISCCCCSCCCCNMCTLKTLSPLFPMLQLWEISASSKDNRLHLKQCTFEANTETSVTLFAHTHTHYLSLSLSLSVLAPRTASVPTLSPFSPPFFWSPHWAWTWNTLHIQLTAIRSVSFVYLYLWVSVSVHVCVLLLRCYAIEWILIISHISVCHSVSFSCRRAVDRWNLRLNKTQIPNTK